MPSTPDQPLGLVMRLGGEVAARLQPREIAGQRHAVIGERRQPVGRTAIGREEAPLRSRPRRGRIGRGIPGAAQHRLGADAGTSHTPVPMNCADLLSMPAAARAAKAADSRGGATGTSTASLPSPLIAPARRRGGRRQVGAVGVVELDHGNRAAAHDGLALERADHLLGRSGVCGAKAAKRLMPASTA